MREQLAAVGAFVTGSWDAAIIDALEPKPDDTIVNKNRYDAFLRTDMEAILRALDATSLLISGVATNVCVESTARAAEMRGYSVTVASDCTSAAGGAHEIALQSMAGIGVAVLHWSDGLERVTD
jgi:ureidoacrylate peracid hydrolase